MIDIMHNSTQNLSFFAFKAIILVIFSSDPKTSKNIHNSEK
ncbi:hypothetical protein ROD_41111 [Citrobacter rodentium ICC168]|uniref:Uncharacterized protein n=1 Tax=Citrobacter rodentium (strain ICC168) TaxID=637910 RepID=D2TI29_CITRI|nr:hypothetical protein ROD_41111 [Citrobacter rodentium ICC168]